MTLGTLHIDAQGKRRQLKPGETCVLGRGQDCDLVLAHAQVSRHHVRIFSDENSWWVEDLGSANGTWLDGNSITEPHPLNAGSQLRLGGHGGLVIRVGMTGAPAAPAGDVKTGRTWFADPGNPVRLPTAPEHPTSIGNAFKGLEAAPATTGQTTIHGGGPQVVAAPAQPITIGRGRDNAIIVQDLLASRHHTRLTPTSSGFDVEDLGSRNGTYVNGARIERGALREGDLLAIGRTRFTVRDGNIIASEDNGDVSFVANHLTFTLPDGKKLLDDITFGVEGSSLVAVIGPSGAGKSTLLKALIGAQQATSGEVYYDGRDLYENYDDLRQRIGVVPQDDVVHSQLTVRQALQYAAELRFPDDLDDELRLGRVDDVIAELDLTKHADTQVARLSGGQRKRTSVALELLTQPSLLFLDEPTSGLDPGLDKRLMSRFRKLADGGRTVICITHNVASLGLCDRVLLLAPGGKVAFFGPPEEMLPYFEAGDHADVFTIVTEDADGAQEKFASSPLMDNHVASPLRGARRTPETTPPEPHRQQTIPHQITTLVRRQLRVIASDKGFVRFTLILPFVLAALAVIVPGKYGLSLPGLDKPHPVKAGAAHATPPAPKQVSGPTQSTQILTLLIMGSVFMGLASTIRELVSERAIYLREKAVGLSPLAYLTSKVLTYSLILIVQCGLLVGVVTAIRNSPDHAIILDNGAFELFVECFLTGLAAMSIGLLLSSFARTSEQVMPMLVITVMGALVFSGGLFALDPTYLRWAASISPSRWGMAMGAQTVHINDILTRNGLKPTGKDTMWHPSHAHWLLSLAALGIIFIVTFIGGWARVRRTPTQ